MAGPLRRWIRRFCLTGIALAMCGATGGDLAAADDGEANRLFVEAVGNMKRADGLPDERAGEKAQLYEMALGNIDRIIASYPESELAVKLVSDEPIGAVSRWGLTRRAIVARARTCVERLDASCLLRQAEAAAASIPGADEAVSAVLEKRAWVYAGLGSKREVLAAAEGIKDAGSRAFALGIAAGIMAGNRQTEDALDVARIAEQSLRLGPDEEVRVYALGWLGWAYHMIGDAAKAADLWAEADSIITDDDDASEYLHGMRMLVAAKIRSGQLAEARRDIERLSQLDREETPNLQIVTLQGGELRMWAPNAMQVPASAALLYGIAGDETEAKAALSDLERALAKQAWSLDRDWVLVFVAETYAELKRYDEARARARSIEGVWNRVLALHEIAGAAKFAGENETARATLYEALGIVAGIEAKEEVASMLADSVAAVLGRSAFY